MILVLLQKAKRQGIKEKTQNYCSVLFKITLSSFKRVCLVENGQDENGLQLEKLAKFPPGVLKIAKN